MALSKRSKIVIALLSPFAVAVLALFLMYRLPISTSKNIDVEIRYQLLEFGFEDYVRYRFEWTMGNRRVYLLNDNIPYLYVSKEDYGKLWPTSPFKRGETTIAGKFAVRKLLSGKYAVARLIDTVTLYKRPYISK